MKRWVLFFSLCVSLVFLSGCKPGKNPESAFSPDSGVPESGTRNSDSPDDSDRDSQTQGNSDLALKPLVIYGDDDRRDFIEMNAFEKRMAAGVAAMVSNRNLQGYRIQGPTKTEIRYFFKQAWTNEDYGVCKDERFSQEILASKCTGFLVQPDVLVTAGHCVQNAKDCDSHKWVFDYKNTHSGKNVYSFTEDQVYSCSAVVSTEEFSNIYDIPGLTGNAVILLDRPVVGAENRVLEMNLKQNQKLGEMVSIIGHPQGMPVKTGGTNKIEKVSENYFISFLDVFGGNSGSPVFDQNGVVQGVLTGGEANEFVEHEGESCQRHFVCDPENMIPGAWNCGGEIATTLGSMDWEGIKTKITKAKSANAIGFRFRHTSLKVNSFSGYLKIKFHSDLRHFRPQIRTRGEIYSIQELGINDGLNCNLQTNSCTFIPGSRAGRSYKLKKFKRGNTTIELSAVALSGQRHVMATFEGEI